MRYEVGDVLVQVKGEPWCTGARWATGHPYPHARLVAKAGTKDDVLIVESGKQYPWQTAGVRVYHPEDMDNFIVLSPLCGEAVKQDAVKWAINHTGKVYNYSRLIQIGLLYRAGLYKGTPGMDDDPCQDNRPMICSELIALAYYRSGFDLVPFVQNVDTLPHNFINNPNLRLIP